MENDETKTNVTTGASVSASDQPIDKSSLFANLLKRQYPMAQEASLQQQEINDDVKKIHHVLMYKLIERYADEL